jgi:hypothetical protein
MPVARESAPMESRAPFVSGATSGSLVGIANEYILNNMKGKPRGAGRALTTMAVATAATHPATQQR